MDIDINIKISHLKGDDFRRLGEMENELIDAAREGVDKTMIELKARRWNRFIRYCHTGRFD